MANRVLLTGLLVLIVIVATETRLMPHGTAPEMATPQQVYFHLHNDDELVAKPYQSLERLPAASTAF
jgi:hypothetical protein